MWVRDGWLQGSEHAQILGTVRRIAVTAEESAFSAIPIDTDITGDYGLRRAADDAAAEPWALLTAVRDAGGRVVDFVFRDVNRIAAQQQGLLREDLLGRSVAETLPEVARSGILDSYIHCVDTGEPLILDDLAYYGRTLDGAELETRRYELRGVRVGTEYLSLNWRDVDRQYRAIQEIAQSEERYRLLAEELNATQRLLVASADSMLDPQMLLEGVRDPAGRVIDLRYREANAAACQDMAMTRDELLGRTVLELLPGFAASGPMSYYVQCLETGQPGVLDDYSYDNEVHADSRRYDIRIAPAGKNLISLTFRDVTERFQATRRDAAAQDLLHATVDSMLNPQSLLEAVRDSGGQVVDFVYRSANAALCSYRGSSEGDIIGQSLLEAQPTLIGSGLFGRYVTCLDTGESVALDDFEMFNSMLGLDCRFDIRVVRAGVDLISLTFSDVTDRFRASARIAASERDYRLLAENAGDLVVLVRDGRFVWVSPSCTDVIGGSPDYWVGREATEIVLPEEGEVIAESTEVVESGVVVQMRHRVQALDGTIHWVDVRAKPFLAPDGREDGLIAAMRVIDDEVAAECEVEKARAQQARSDALYRRLMDNSPIGMTISNPDGRYVAVNQAVCQIFGYSEAELLQMTWQDVTVEEDIGPGSHLLREILAGRLETFEFTGQQNRRDKLERWSKVGVSCLRAADGTVEQLIGQIVDVTAETLAQRELTEQSERNRELAQGLQSELSSAAKYLQSVLPGDMAGQVSVANRYLPSQTLGGDCFDYRWIDDDHLIIYLLDVSGHGVESALIAVSVHNMLRSTFTTETMLEPDRVLATLNQQFGMDHHDGNYFTIFYGVYQRSTGTLRYASAGHPPALVFTHGHLIELPSQSFPLGMFEDTSFTATNLEMPPGSQMLLYSDGAYELTLNDGGQWSLQAFVDSCARLGRSPDWTLDDVVATALGHSVSGSFDDDCSLIRLTFA